MSQVDQQKYAFSYLQSCTWGEVYSPNRGQIGMTHMGAEVVFQQTQLSFFSSSSGGASSLMSKSFQLKTPMELAIQLRYFQLCRSYSSGLIIPPSFMRLLGIALYIPSQRWELNFLKKPLGQDESTMQAISAYCKEALKSLSSQRQALVFEQMMALSFFIEYLVMQERASSQLVSAYMYLFSLYMPLAQVFMASWVFWCIFSCVGKTFKFMTLTFLDLLIRQWIYSTLSVLLKGWKTVMTELAIMRSTSSVWVEGSCSSSETRARWMKRSVRWGASSSQTTSRDTSFQWRMRITLTLMKVWGFSPFISKWMVLLSFLLEVEYLCLSARLRWGILSLRKWRVDISYANFSWWARASVYEWETGQGSSRAMDSVVDLYFQLLGYFFIRKQIIKRGSSHSTTINVVFFNRSASKYFFTCPIE